MPNDKIRISKPPEERKQDIVEAAMRLFTERGYECTTMREIAASIDVVPGLCYRYFESKQVLFDYAIQQYVIDFGSPIIQLLRMHKDNIDDLIINVIKLFLQREGKEKYHNFFHKEENKNFHILLFYSSCDYLLPFLIEALDHYNEVGITSIVDTTSTARFLLYAQIPILNDDLISIENKGIILNDFIRKVLS